MNRRSAVDHAAREARSSAIRRCDRCDPCGWQLGPDRTPIDPAIRCTHNSPSAAADRGIAAPIHEPDLLSQLIHQPHDTRSDSL